MAVSRLSAGAPARTCSMALWTASPRMRTSVGPTLGLATVSISVAVSPKSLTHFTGPAPAGRSEMFVTRFPMSANCSTVSAMSSCRCTSITATPSRVVVSIFLTLEFPAAACSIFRVTSSSTRSAGTPGQGQTASAIRTGMSGSFRFGIRLYPAMPAAMERTRRAQATCRCWTQKRARLKPFIWDGFTSFMAAPAGMTSTRSPSMTMVAPVVMTCSPRFRP